MMNNIETVQKSAGHGQEKANSGKFDHEKELLNNEGSRKSDRRNLASNKRLKRPGAKIVSLHDYAKWKGVKVMSDNEKEIKMKAFNPETVTLFCEELESDSLTLRAFGMLLETSSLNYFSEDLFEDAWLYRKGLRNIVELYLDRQEQKLNEIKSRSLSSPEWLIEQAEVICSNTRHGCWKSHEVALEKTREKIQTMNQVIATFGAEEYPRAQKVLEDLLDLKDSIKARMDAQKVAKDLETAEYNFRKAEAEKARKAEADQKR